MDTMPPIRVFPMLIKDTRLLVEENGVSGRVVDSEACNEDKIAEGDKMGGYGGGGFTYSAAPFAMLISNIKFMRSIGSQSGEVLHCWNKAKA